MTRSDTDRLLSRLQAGDPKVRSQLLLRYAKPLKRMIRFMIDPRLSSRVDDSDVLQEAFIRADGKLADYAEKRPLAFYPWLRRIVLEELIHAQRRHLHAQRRSVLRERELEATLSDISSRRLSESMIATHSTASQSLMKEENRQLLKKALDCLDESDRQLLLMRYVESVPVNEIAELMEETPTCIKSRLRRALEKLARQLRGDNGNGN